MLRASEQRVNCGEGAEVAIWKQNIQWVFLKINNNNGAYVKNDDIFIYKKVKQNIIKSYQKFSNYIHEKTIYIYIHGTNWCRMENE